MTAFFVVEGPHQNIEQFLSVAVFARKAKHRDWRAVTANFFERVRNHFRLRGAR